MCDIMSHIWISHVCTYEWAMSRIWISHVTHKNQSCHTHKDESCYTFESVLSHIWRVMSHIWIRFHTYWRVISHIWMRVYTYRRVVSHIWMGCITHMNESCYSRTILRNTKVQKLSYYFLPRLVLVCTKLPKLPEQCRESMLRMRHWQGRRQHLLDLRAMQPARCWYHAIRRFNSDFPKQACLAQKQQPTRGGLQGFAMFSRVEACSWRWSQSLPHRVEWVTSRKWMSHEHWAVIHFNRFEKWWNESRHMWMKCVTCEWIMSYMQEPCHTWISHVTHMNESCHTYEWVMSHIWMSHVTHMNESRHTYEWVVYTYEWVTSYVKTSRVTHMNESCHTGEVCSHSSQSIPAMILPCAHKVRVTWLIHDSTRVIWLIRQCNMNPFY